MKMKLHLSSVLFLSLLLLYAPFSLAKRGGGGGGARKTSSGSRSSTSTSHKPNKGSTSQGGHPKENNQGGGQGGHGGYGGQGGYGGYGGQGGHGGYGGQGGHGGYGGQGGYGGYGGQGGYGGYGGQGGYGGYGGQGGYGGGYRGQGGYPGTYINKNPNNKILSPHYGGSFGYGGYAAGGGSPFSNHVKAQGFVPSDRSKGFGHSAVKAAAGGAVVGMALGYGLGSFSRPHFDFRSPQEEYYYNHYMYRKHGSTSSNTNTNTNSNTNTNTNRNTNTKRNTNTNTNDYSGGNAGDNVFTKPPQRYDNYMDACMKRRDVLSAETQKSKNKTAATATAKTKTNTSIAVISESNVTTTENFSTPTSSNPGLLNQPEDDDTVSIVEIGYPALIEQVKARRCLELYMAHYENYRRLPGDGVSRAFSCSYQYYTVVTSTILMLLNSNVLVLLP